MTEPPRRPVVIAFPGPRARATQEPVAPRNLGLTTLSKSLGPMATSPKGHWCDHCQGVWYSHLGEARCPVCGNKS